LDRSVAYAPRSLDWQTCLGVVLLALALVLSLPGIRIARADDAGELAQQSQAPLQCSASKASQDQVVPAELNVMAQIQRLIRERAANGDNPDVVVLNGRGYNYGAAPLVNFDALRREGALDK
jgi:hypothetical protein